MTQRDGTEPLAIRRLELRSRCDVCGNGRSHGSHTRCSKIRQQRNAHKWEGKK